MVRVDVVKYLSVCAGIEAAAVTLTTSGHGWRVGAGVTSSQGGGIVIVNVSYTLPDAAPVAGERVD